MKIEEEIKQTKFTNFQQKAIINLLFTASWLQNQLNSFLKASGITIQQFNILRILRGQHPKSLSASEIKSRMLDQNSDVSRLIDRLILKGYVIKQTCISDKRATDVSITESGLELLKDLIQNERKMNRIFQLSEDDALVLSNLLDKARGS